MSTVDNPLLKLSSREIDIMRELIKGCSNKIIGKNLNITDGTVKIHMKHIYQKLNIKNRVSAAIIAFQYLPKIGNDYVTR